MIDDVDELLALRAGDKYRLNDIRRRLEIYKRWTSLTGNL